MKFIKENLLIIILGVFFFFFFNSKVSELKTEKKELKEIINYVHESKQYISKSGKEVSYNKSLEVSLNSLLATQDSLIDYIKELDLKIKNVKSTTVITERLKTDTVEVPILFTECSFDTTLHIDSSHYNMDFTIRNDLFRVNSLEFPNRQNITISDRKEKWYKRPENIVTITNTNPYIKTEGITSYTIKQPLVWYEKPWLNLLVGTILGGTVYYFISN